MQEKQCNFCKGYFHTDDFQKNSYHSDGLSHFCKTCGNAKKRLGRKLKKSNKDSLILEGYKKCTICKKIKTLEEFHNNAHNQDGLAYDCKECKLQYSKQYKSKEKNTPDFKECADCKITLSINNFLKAGSGKDGYSIRCKKCDKIVSSDRAKKNRVPILEKSCSKCKKIYPIELFRKKDDNYDGYSSRCKFCISTKVPDKLRWSRATTHSHFRKGHSVNFTPEQLCEFVKDKNTCDFCECDLLWANKTGKPQQNSPSLENINLNVNINLDNIAIICRRCNTTKSNRTLKEYIEYINKILPNLIKVSEIEITNDTIIEELPKID